jgi:transcriptional regulator with PAS, ATPase and Fis domain
MPTKQSSHPLSAKSQEIPRLAILTERDVDILRPALRTIISQRDAIISEMARLYVSELGEPRARIARRFVQIFAGDLAVQDLLENGVDAYATVIGRRGEKLAAAGVLFQDVLSLLHYLWRAYLRVIPDLASSIDTRDLIAKMSHLQTSELMAAYLRVQSAHTGARIHALEREASRVPTTARTSFHGLLGSSPVMRHLYEQIEAAARIRGTVLLTGESGSGKELVARAIHECGGDLAAPFVAVNAAALPRELVESELFGYRRGAFSGSSQDHPGLIRSAHGGTLFLDEITEMDLDLQSKLLRVLAERTVRPVGSLDEFRVNVRIIASTNRSPEEMVKSRRLRHDLYFRLQRLEIAVAPLRDRLEDLPLLVAHFIDLANATLKPVTARRGFDRKAMNAMNRYPWPGNVRELSNAIEAAVALGNSPLMGLDDLPARISPDAPVRALSRQSSGGATLDDTERGAIQKALESAYGNRTAAAKLLGISRKMLYGRLSKYRI